MREVEGRRLISSMVRMRGRSTMPWIRRRCFLGSMVGTPPRQTSKCSADGVMVPNISPSGVKFPPHSSGIDGGPFSLRASSKRERSP
jgi:hypothetical protein